MPIITGEVFAFGLASYRRIGSKRWSVKHSLSGLDIARGFEKLEEAREFIMSIESFAYWLDIVASITVKTPALEESISRIAEHIKSKSERQGDGFFVLDKESKVKG